MALLIVGAVATIKLYQSTTENEQSGDSDSSRYVASQETYLAMYEPVTFNVLRSKEEDVVYLNQLVYSSLFRLDETLNIVPDLVSSYSMEPESGVLDISLRDDAIFSNNMHVTAQDVITTIETIKEIGQESPYYIYVNRIADIRINDTYSLSLRFSNPDISALDNLVFPIISDADYTRDQGFAVGSGPYVYGYHNKGEYVRLLPNPFYYGEIPTQTIDISIIKDKSAVPGLITMDAVTAFLSKDQNSDTIASDRSLLCKAIPSGELEYLGFNHTNQFLSDSNIRQAMAFAIDRESIINDDYGRAGTISDSLYFPGFLGSDPEEKIAFEPKTSADLLTSLGMRDMDEDGIIENSDGDDMSFRLIVDSSKGNRVDAARSLSEDLASIGINVNVAPLDKDTFFAELQAGNFDLYMAGLKIDKQFNLSELYGPSNYGHYNGEQVISLTKELEKMHSQEEQTNIFRDLKQSLYNEVPYFAICYKNYYFLSVTTLDTKTQVMYFDPYRNIGSWTWQKRDNT